MRPVVNLLRAMLLYIVMKLLEKHTCLIFFYVGLPNYMTVMCCINDVRRQTCIPPDWVGLHVDPILG